LSGSPLKKDTHPPVVVEEGDEGGGGVGRGRGGGGRERGGGGAVALMFVQPPSEKGYTSFGTPLM
jgi:hypothetical protein